MRARRLAYLDALGIEVWVRRGRRPVPPPAGAGRGQQDELAAARDAPTPVRPGGRRLDEQPADLPATPPAEAVVATPAAEAVPDAPPPADPPVRFVIRCFRFGRTLAMVDAPLWRHLNLLTDIARALDAHGAGEREDIVFEWPQLTVGDAGMAAAGAAFRAFLAAETTGETRWLAAGARVRALLGDVPLDAHMVLPDALETIDKRALWREILAKR